MEQLAIKTINRERLSDTVRMQLTQLITEQALVPGDKLPSEGELADMFGVSKTIIREVLRGLAAMGVVEIQHGRRAMVRAPSAEPLESYFKFAVSSSKAGLREAVDLRRMLETQIAILAAERITDEQVKKLVAAVEKMKETLGTIEPWLDADFELHMAIAQSTRNSLMVHLVEALSGLFRESMHMLHLQRGPHGVDATLARHVKIFEALKARDPEAVKRAMDAHFDAIDRTIMEMENSK